MNTREVANFFNRNWGSYKNRIQDNRLCHTEMFATLSSFLQEHGKYPITLVDAGCGDAALLAEILPNIRIKKYIGIDVAQELIELASASLAEIPCEKELYCADMSEVIADLVEPVDIIFSSYALHHLSFLEKFQFIKQCKRLLQPEGKLILIDGVREALQTREEWIVAYEDYIRLHTPTISNAELNWRMQHPRNSDFPETIQTFATMARNLQWGDFQILKQIGLLTFMVFSLSTPSA